jgi:phage gpG-like protein
MAAPVTGGMSSGRGGVSMQLVPPLSFILRQTGAFRAALMDLEPLWALFRPIMAEVEQEQFESHGHGEWPPLAESTLRQKTGGEMLVQSGEMKDSFSLTSSARQAEWGTSVFYAAFHQDGTTKMPQRQVIPDPFRAEDRRKLEGAMVAYVNAAARSTFGRIAA